KLSTTPTIAVNQGGILTLDNTVPSSDRVSDSIPITLSGGTLTYTGDGTPAANETLGNIVLGAGLSTINSANGILTLNSLTRAAASGGFINFAVTGAVSATNQVQLISPPLLTGTGQPLGTGLLPYATVTSGGTT